MERVDELRKRIGELEHRVAELAAQCDAARAARDYHHNEADRLGRELARIAHESVDAVLRSALRRAEVASGERCKQCDTFIWPAAPDTQLCYDCRDFAANDAAVWHDHAIRCPSCGDVQIARDRYWEDGIWTEDTHTLYCSECEAEFEIETAVSYSFKSPARKK